MMPNDWNIGLAGQQGQPGIPGPAGGVFADAPSDGTYYGRTNANWARVLGLAGGTMTGQLVASGSGTPPQIAINKPASGQESTLVGTMNGLPRWALVLGESTAEGGSNAGSHLYIRRYGDNGALIDTPFSLNRTSGQTGIANLSAGPISCGNITCNQITNSGSGTYSGYLYSYGQGYIASNLTVGGEIDCQGNRIASPGIIYGSLQNGVNWMGFAYGSGYIFGYVDGGSLYPFASASDERLKQDIAPSTFDALGALNGIPLFQFRWKDLDESPQRAKAAKADSPLIPHGIVAQRVYDVVPHVIAKGDYQPAGSGDLENPMRLWTSDINNMFALLIGAVQQLSKRVEALEARLP